VKISQSLIWKTTNDSTTARQVGESMVADKTPATDTEEKNTYPIQVYDKRDKTIDIPLVDHTKIKNDDMEVALWADYMASQEKVREFHRIRAELIKERPEV